GLLQLKHIDRALACRQEIDRFYREQLGQVKGIRLIPPAGQQVCNYSYFPILVEGDFPRQRDELYAEFRRHDIYVRRYFYPLISSFPMYRGLASAQAENLVTATEMSNKVLCLPIYPDLPRAVQERVVDIIRAMV